MAFVQKVSATVNSAATIAPSLTGVTAGNTLALVLSTTSTADNTPADSASQTWSKAFYITVSSAATVAVYYLLSANAGTHTVTWTAGGSSFVNYTLVEIPACSAVDVVSTGGAGSNTITTLSSPSITTTNANDSIIAAFSADTASGFTNAGISDPPSGWTSLYAQQNTAANVGAQHAYKEVSATGAQSATWTFSADATGSSYAAAAVSFKRSAAAGVSGTVATTQGKNTSAASGAVTASGAGAPSQGKNTPAGAGSAVVSGNASVAQAANSGTASGTVGSAVAGGAAAIQAGNSSAAVGTVSVSGAAAPTSTTGVSSGSGAVAVSGATAATQAKSSSAAAGTAGGALSVTLKQKWSQQVSVGNPATLITGANPMTVTAGDTLICVTSGSDNNTQPPATDSAGTFVIPTNGRQNLAGSDNIWCSIAYQANAAGGSHTITPGAVNAGGSGEIAHWILEVTNMPATASIRGVFVSKAINTSSSWSVSSDTSVQAGDIAFVLGMYENTAPFGASDISDPPTGWTSVGYSELNGTTFTPTTVAYKVVPTSGVAVTANYATTDPTISEHISIMLVMVPNASASAVTGTVSAAQAKNTVAAAGGVIGSGVGTVTQQLNVSVASGQADVGAAGTPAQAQNSMNAAGGPSAAGAAAPTQAVGVGSGQGTTSIAGSASSTQSINLNSAAGASVVLGSTAAAQAPNTSTAVGGTIASGGSSATQTHGTAAGIGQALVAGAGGPAQSANSGAATGNVVAAGTIAGNVASMQAPNLAVGVGGVSLAGAAAVIQAGNIEIASGAGTIAGAAAPLQAASSATASGTVTAAGAISGHADVLQALNGAASQGVIVIGGAGAATAARNTIQATGQVFAPGSSMSPTHGFIVSLGGGTARNWSTAITPRNWNATK